MRFGRGDVDFIDKTQRCVFYHVDSHSKELIALCPDILLMSNRPVSKVFCETKSRDVIEIGH
jgi:hypothetical protein